jgi:hypothetical protein
MSPKRHKFETLGLNFLNTKSLLEFLVLLSIATIYDSYSQITTADC